VVVAGHTTALVINVFNADAVAHDAVAFVICQERRGAPLGAAVIRRGRTLACGPPGATILKY
jgi:hypothetical protein